MSSSSFYCAQSKSLALSISEYTNLSSFSKILFTVYWSSNTLFWIRSLILRPSSDYVEAVTIWSGLRSDLTAGFWTWIFFTDFCYSGEKFLRLEVLFITLAVLKTLYARGLAKFLSISPALWFVGDWHPLDPDLRSYMFLDKFRSPVEIYGLDYLHALILEDRLVAKYEPFFLRVAALYLLWSIFIF